MKRPRQEDEPDDECQKKKLKIETSSRKRKNENSISQPCKKIKLYDTNKEELQYRRDILLYL
jgi:hypothetical protein